MEGFTPFQFALTVPELFPVSFAYWTVVAQLLAGIVNLVLLALVGIQLVHLLLADLLWIVLVALCWHSNIESTHRH
jgi:hypothetical protein